MIYEGQTKMFKEDTPTLVIGVRVCALLQNLIKNIPNLEKHKVLSRQYEIWCLYLGLLPCSPVEVAP